MAFPAGAPTALHPTKHVFNSGRQAIHGPSSLAEALDWIADEPATSGASHTALGRLVRTPDERPIRSIITGRKRHVTGSYASRKARRAMPHESMYELALFQLSEVDTNVVDYLAQPFRFEFVIEGRARTYIADCARLLADGSVEVVEVKADQRPLQDPDYASKLRAVDQLCRRLGWQFRTVTKVALLTPPAWRRNVLEIQSRRMANYGDADCYVALDILKRRSTPVPLGELEEALGGAPRGRAVAMAMMVGRILRIDLEHPLTTNTLVWRVEDPISHLVEGDR